MQKEHPAWGFAKFLVVCILLTVLMWGEATNFDETELRVIGQFAALYAAGKWGGKLLNRGSEDG